MELADLMTARTAARKELGEISGVEGFGIGDGSLRVYVHDAAVKKLVPSEFHGIPVDCVVIETVLPLTR
jgi:hypothetical protein